MWRLILVVWRGGIVAGEPAQVAEVRWEDYGTWSEAREAREGELSKGLAAGFSLFTPNFLCRGVGADYRAVEVWIVDAQSGRTVGQLERMEI